METWPPDKPFSFLDWLRPSPARKLRRRQKAPLPIYVKYDPSTALEPFPLGIFENTPLDRL